MENVDKHWDSLPRHGPLLQSSVSKAAPEQSFPRPSGGGLVQLRVRFRCPEYPQETEQGK